MEGEAHLGAELMVRFRRASAETMGPESRPREGGRNVLELIESAEEHAEIREREEAERRARAEAERRRREAEARARYLDGLVGREEELWRQAESLIEMKLPTKYDQAVPLLKDLRDLAARSGASGEFESRLGALRAHYYNRPALLQRLDKAGLKARLSAV